MIEKRKKEHMDIAKTKAVGFEKTNGFEDIEFIHNALPELHLEDINIKIEMFGKKMDAPFVIEAISGGWTEGGEINKQLAKIAQKYKIAMQLGSQRAMLENKELLKTYDIREYAPDIPLMGNIGLSQLKDMSISEINHLVESIQLDALVVHLNPAQEAIQPEGDVDFRDCLKTIEDVCKKTKFPIVVKEVGSGISKTTAEKLKKAGVSMIDTAGAGGTSWTKIEYNRNKNAVKGFEEWGIPTAVSVKLCSKYLPTIASGGIRNGEEIAKAIALGADYAGAASPFINNDPEKNIQEWTKQLKTIMFLTGSKDLKGLKEAEVFITGKTAERLRWINE